MTKKQRKKMVSVRLPIWLINWLKNHGGSQGRLIEAALIKTHNIKNKQSNN